MTRTILAAVVVAVGAACAATSPSTNLDAFNASSPPATMPGITCLTGYAQAGERRFISSDREGSQELPTVVPVRRTDGDRIARFAGKRVKVCGTMVPVALCWKARAVCTMYRRPIDLERMTSIAEAPDSR